MITPYKSREIDHTTPVKIYRNLNRKGKVYSILQSGLVVGHLLDQELVLSNVTMKVSQKGRERVLIEKTRNVHAYICGTILTEFGPPTNKLLPLKYNPYKYSTFVGDNNTPVHKADRVYFAMTGIYYSNLNT